MGVADGDNLCALFACVAHGHQGVHGFARLREGHNQGLLVHDRVAVAELVGELNLGGDTAPVFDGVACHLARVCGGTASNHDDLVNRAQHRVVDVQLVEGQITILVEAAHEGLLNGGRLLVDFLLHEGVVATLFGCGCVPLDVEGLTLCGIALEVDNRVVGCGDGHDLVLTHLHGFLGVVDERGDVRTEEVLVAAQANHQRRVAAGCHNTVRVVGVDSQDGEGTLEAVGGDTHGLGEVTGTELVVDACDGCGGYLGVSLRGELHALGEQLSTQFCKVFDNTVVDDGEAAVVNNVGVSVDVGGSTVGCPTGVTDTNLGFRQGVFLNLVLEVQELACLLTEFDTVGAHQCHASRVIAAVFLAAQTFEQCPDLHILRFHTCYKFISWSRLSAQGENLLFVTLGAIFLTHLLFSFTASSLISLRFSFAGFYPIVFSPWT